MNQNRMESSDLVDIRTVTVDKSLPKEERLLCQKWSNIGGLSARDSQIGDKLAFSGRSDTMYMEKDET